MTELTKMNRYVYKKFLQANINQKQEMIRVLKEQMENLNFLLLLMEGKTNDTGN